MPGPIQYGLLCSRSQLQNAKQPPISPRAATTYQLIVFTWTSKLCQGLSRWEWPRHAFLGYWLELGIASGESGIGGVEAAASPGLLSAGGVAPAGETGGMVMAGGESGAGGVLGAVAGAVVFGAVAAGVVSRTGVVAASPVAGVVEVVGPVAGGVVGVVAGGVTAESTGGDVTGAAGVYEPANGPAPPP